MADNSKKNEAFMEMLDKKISSVSSDRELIAEALKNAADYKEDDGTSYLMHTLEQRGAILSGYDASFPQAGSDFGDMTAEDVMDALFTAPYRTVSEEDDKIIYQMDIPGRSGIIHLKDLSQDTVLDIFSAGEHGLFPSLKGIEKEEVNITHVIIGTKDKPIMITLFPGSLEDLPNMSEMGYKEGDTITVRQALEKGVTIAKYAE